LITLLFLFGEKAKMVNSVAAPAKTRFGLPNAVVEGY
jgi:hypothetical protein